MRERHDFPRSEEWDAEEWRKWVSTCVMRRRGYLDSLVNAPLSPFTEMVEWLERKAA
jgi:hypothetical protein